MRARRGAASAAAGLMLLAGLTTVGVTTPAQADDSHPTSYPMPKAQGETARNRAEVLQRTAVLTPANRPVGFPTRAEPFLQLTSAEFSIYLDDGEAFAEAYLAGSPPPDYDPTVFFEAGTAIDGTCTITSAGFSAYFPDQYANEYDDFPSPEWATADCVVVELHEPEQGALVDAFVARLSDQLPELSLGKPELLGSTKLKLVRGVWTSLDVGLSNAGPGTAARVVVGGRGKGLKVRPGTVDYPINAESSGSAEVQVKLVGKQKKAKLTLEAADGAAKVTQAVTVRRIAPPAPPKPGRYRDKSGRVSFFVRGGKVTGFNVTTQTTCGGFGTIPTYTQNTYDFPSTRIARNGIVDREKNTDLYNSSLALRIAGSKVTYGSFGFGSQGPCRAGERFTAKRVGG